MATIEARKRKSGTRYTARIIIRRGGEIVHREAETFSLKSLAKTWADRREAELATPGVLEKLRHAGISIKQVLNWYVEDYEGNTKFGLSKLTHINQMINNPDLSELDALSLTSGQLVAHVRRRSKAGAGPATINNDFIWLRIAFRAIRIGRDIPLELQAIDDAAFICRKEGMIAKAKQRDRRPTIGELDQLLEFFGSMTRAEIPMAEIMLFALFSTRRQDEICRIRWEDVDEDKQRVLVREMKHPRAKVDTWVDIPDRAWEVLQRQPKDDPRIFPYMRRSVSASFTRACKMLGIKDLRFHDLRHEGTSWLFEQGLDIPRVALVTGHKSWPSLQRYTHIEQVGDKYANWPTPR